MIIASIGDFLGNLWFAGLALMVGYVGGSIFPVSKIKEWFSK